MSNWCLVEDLDVLCRDNEIWFCPINLKKQKLSSLVKKIRGTYQVNHIEGENAFNLKLAAEDGALNLYAEYEGAWKKVMNQNHANLLSILTQCNISSGVIDGKTFEAAFGGDESVEVSLVCEGMKEYDDYLDEMIRKFNFKTHRKSRRFKVGHRYDSENETFIVLGKVYSHKSDMFSSQWLSGVGMSEMYLVSNRVTGYTKVSEVLQNQTFDDHLQVYKNLPVVVDGGEILKDDVKDYKQYWETIIGNSKTLKGRLEVVNIDTTDGQIPQLKYDDLMMEPFRRLMEKCVVYFYNNTHWGVELSEKDAPDKQAEDLINLAVGELKDPNALRLNYYKDLFSYLGFDLHAAALEIVKNYHEEDMWSNFDTYFKMYPDFYKYRCPRIQMVYQRVNSNYSDNKVKQTTSEVFGPELGEVIKEIANKAISNYGLGVDDFNVRRAGRTEYYEITVSLPDLVNSGLLTSEIKNQVLERKFYKARIELDKGKKVE